MANSTTNINTLTSEQNGKEITVNGFLDAASQAALFGRDYVTTTDLIWGYIGGNFNLATGSYTFVANGTVALTDNATNYLQVNPLTGAVTCSGSVAANNIQLYTIVTTGGSVVSYSDDRIFKLNHGAAPVVDIPVTSYTSGATITLSHKEALATGIILSGTNAGTINIQLPAFSGVYTVANRSTGTVVVRGPTATNTVSISTNITKQVVSDGSASVYGTA